MWKTSGIVLFTLVLSILNINIADVDLNINTGNDKIDPPFYSADSIWVDSVFNTMTEDERIAQLFMVQAYSNKGVQHENHINSLIDKYGIGGLIFMQGGPIRQIDLLNDYQTNSKIPLLIAMDAEWSLSMRLDSTVLYPRQMMIGAIQDNQLVYEMGGEFARQLKRVGVHVNFAPVIDVNNNPNNPVINDRSFGEDKYNVALKAYNYMKGMQDAQVLATGKHFPGHGDTNVDSHKSLPTINHSFARLDSIELYPFRYLINKGMGAIMVAHLFVPAIDSTPNIPTTLSSLAVNDLLKKDMGFKGLVFTDAMNMGGVANHYKPGEADVKALLAGNDVLLFPNDIEIVLAEIKNAISQGLITQEEIDQRCKKILMAKYWAGLNEFKPISSENIYEDLNNVDARFMQQKLIENAITLVSNKDSIIPIQNLDTLKIASISFGLNKVSPFQDRLKYYAQTTDFVYSSAISAYGSEDNFINALSDYDLIIADIHGTSRYPSRNFGLNDKHIKFLDTLAVQSNLILDVFANPYSLDYFKNADKMIALIVSYNDWEITNDFSAQLVFGGIPAKGRLPICPNETFPIGTGVDTEKIRLKYTRIPEEAGVDSELLYKVDSVIDYGLTMGAYPGGQVVATRNEIVFYQRAFGYHTNSRELSVKNLDVYDLASVTKVAGTNAALMKLYDNDIFELDDTLANYLELLDTTNKDYMIFQDILTHRAGLKSWIPFYKETLETVEKKSQIYSSEMSDTFSIQVADGLFINKYYRDTILQRICVSDLNPHGTYVYSDLGFYLFALFVEQETNYALPDYLDMNFYKSMGAWTLGYWPLDRFDKSKIVPTERDDYFRYQQLHGHVHDQGASMLGGMSGHAGLFSSANDVMKILQMYLNKGEYAQKRYISSETIDLFTKYQFNPELNRRGLGFDKKHPTDTSIGIGSKSSSENAFGHGGYTGTMVWADPDYDFALVINTNRNCPSSNNWKIIKYNIRTEVEEAFYQAIISFDGVDELEFTATNEIVE